MNTAAIQSLAVTCALACLVLSPAAAQEGAKKKKKETEVKQQKAPAGASCKAPAVGPCGSCGVICGPNEAARCVPGQPAGSLCHVQPACRCGP